MTEQDAKRMSSLFGRTEQFFRDMNVNPLTYIGRQLRWEFHLTGARTPFAIRTRILNEQENRCAVSGVALKICASTHLDHIWKCEEAARAIWFGGMPYEDVARRLWDRDNLRIVTKSENDKHKKAIFGKDDL